ncbi:cold shock domain-containing protein, partial [Octadecabacter sp.]|nr:cold shock domain-containing protein [Octadecabacter sp.]
MQDTDIEGYVMDGRVKWFDPGKGFGFIVATDGGHDILLHANVLRNFGQSSVADGTEIQILVVETDRGLQAAEV